jgi:hypothetical protein
MSNALTDQFGLSGNISFEDPNIPVLEMQIPIRILKRLVAGPSTRYLQVRRSEIVGLLRIIAANPETTEADRLIVKQILKA